jgi:hypothetical protein
MVNVEYEAGQGPATTIQNSALTIQNFLFSATAMVNRELREVL